MKTCSLFLTYESSSEGGQNRWSSRSPQRITIEFTGVYRTNNAFFGHGHEVPLKVWAAPRVWLVVVRYTDGDSFGTCHGNWTLCQICCSSEEAEKVKTSITDGSYAGHKPWDGYFESLEEIEIHEFEVKESQE